MERIMDNILLHRIYSLLFTLRKFAIFFINLTSPHFLFLMIKFNHNRFLHHIVIEFRVTDFYFDMKCIRADKDITIRGAGILDRATCLFHMSNSGHECKNDVM